MVTFTDEQKQAVVDAAIEQIKARAVEQAVDDLSRWSRQAVANVIDETISSYVKAEVVPAIIEELTVNKAALVKAAVDGAETIAAKIAEAMVAKVTHSLSSDYKRDQILKAMF